MPAGGNDASIVAIHDPVVGQLPGHRAPFLRAASRREPYCSRNFPLACQNSVSSSLSLSVTSPAFVLGRK